MNGNTINERRTSRRQVLGHGLALSHAFALLLWAASSAVTASEITSSRGPIAPDVKVPDGSVILFRHAIAPGGGDPSGFRLDDCSTQRNLDAQGREQARRMGEQLLHMGVRVSAVWTSQWCRTRETAALAFPKQRVIEQPAFNSFYGDPSKADAQTAQAQALLQDWRGPGILAVTTHQVNISALTGISPSAGEGIIVMRSARGGMVVIGRVPAPGSFFTPAASSP